MINYEKLYTKMPKHLKKSYDQARIQDNFSKLILLSILILIVQVVVFSLSLTNPFTDVENVLVIYNGFYVTYITLNIIGIVSMIYLFKVKKLRSKIVTLVMVLQIVFTHQWAMGVGIADLFQGEGIVVYYSSMFILAIFINVTVLELALNLLIHYWFFSYQIVKFIPRFGIEANLTEILAASFQFIVFALIIRYILDQLNKSSFIYKSKLEKANSELEYLSYYDPLSSLFNRRKFEREYKAFFSKAVKNQSLLGVALIDIDFFKQYNDSYGHILGDKVIRDVSNELISACENSDTIYGRFGGDEFILTFLNDEQTNQHIIEEFVNRVSNLRIPHKDSLTNDFITVSIGYYSSIPVSDIQSEDYVIQADKDLYRIKRSRVNKP